MAKAKPQFLFGKNRGFTVIEAVVATAVFAFVVSAVLGVYVATFKLDRKTRAERAVAQNARFMMEFFAKELRNGNINYASYPGGTVGTSQHLFIQNQANEVEDFYLSGTDLMMTKTIGGVTTGPTKLNTAGTTVTNLDFYITPDSDPFTTARDYSVQPHVTVVLQLTNSYGTSLDNQAVLDLQNTFSVRVYPSREP